MRNEYLDLEGNVIRLGQLDEEERRLVARLRRRSRIERDWGAFDNYWMRALDRFYGRRGLSAEQIERTPVYRIAEDLSGRLEIDLGLARAPDYRDELEEVIRTRVLAQRMMTEGGETPSWSGRWLRPTPASNAAPQVALRATGPPCRSRYDNAPSADPGPPPSSTRLAIRNSASPIKVPLMPLAMLSLSEGGVVSP